MGAVRIEGVGVAGNQLRASTRRTLANVRHANGRVHIGAQATENALAQIERGHALTVRIFIGNRAGGADPCARTSILPVGPIDLRFAPRSPGEFGRSLGIAGGDDAGSEALTER